VFSSGCVAAHRLEDHSKSLWCLGLLWRWPPPMVSHQRANEEGLCGQNFLSSHQSSVRYGQQDCLKTCADGAQIVRTDCQPGHSRDLTFRATSHFDGQRPNRTLSSKRILKAKNQQCRQTVKVLDQFRETPFLRANRIAGHPEVGPLPITPRRLRSSLKSFWQDT